MFFITGLFSLLSNYSKKIFFFFAFLLLFASSGYAETVSDGSVPRWITGPQSDLVNNMRALVPKMPRKYPHGDGTTCVYSVSVALRGTPYGASKDYGLDISHKYEGDLICTDDLRLEAQKIGTWHFYGQDGYQPKPGDIAITVGCAKVNGETIYYEDGHAVMITESGGCIYGGSSSNTIDSRLGMIETNLTPEQNYEKLAEAAGFDPVYGYIDVGGDSGVLNNHVNWGLDMLATIADSLNETMEQFATFADEAMDAFHAIGSAFIIALIAIDFATFVILNGFDVGFQDLLSLLMKYAFLLFIFLNWRWIVNNVFLDFAESTASVLANGNTSSNMTQPQFLLVRGVESISPALNFISTAKGLTDIKNWPLLAFLVLLTFLVLFWLIFSAIYIAFIYIEFYLMAAFNAIFMLFPMLRFTKFIGEGGLGSLIQATIKLFVAACLVNIVASLVGDANFLLDFPADINALGDGTLRRYILLCIHICVLCCMVIFIPDKIAKIYRGPAQM